MSIRIIKTEPYVWRANATFGYQSHNYITSWEVWDGERKLFGGHHSGSNYRSGYARCPTRTEAQAFVDGYTAQQAGQLVSLVGTKRLPEVRREVNPYAGERGRKIRTVGLRNEAISAFAWGALCAYRDGHTHGLDSAAA